MRRSKRAAVINTTAVAIGDSRKKGNAIAKNSNKDDANTNEDPNAIKSMSHPAKRKRLEKTEPVVVSRYFLNSKQAPSNNDLRLGREFFDVDCDTLCKNLLGTILCRRIHETGEILKGTIVETEAYPGGNDRASQSYQGRRTPRNEAMYMDPGTAYVYFTYGMYYCFNISSKGEGSACLIRAAEPLENYDTMHSHREAKKKSKSAKKLNWYELANGPSKLCIAFNITRDSCDKIDMAKSDSLWLEKSQDLKYLKQEFEIGLDKRIGIDSTPKEARDKLWRFFVKDSFAESRAKVGELKRKQKES